MKLFYSEYEFAAKVELNSAESSAPLVGCLLKVEFADGRVGFSDLRPHPGLGDPPLAAQLLSLRGGVPHDLATRSLSFAALDAQARGEGVSLLADLKLPLTHALAGPLRTTSEEWLADVSHLRFEFAKFKVGLDSKFEAEKLKSWLADWPQGLKIRLDFNESLSEEGFHNWLQNFGRDELALVDFIEDPFQYSKASWSRIDGVTLALDRSLNESTVGEWLSGAVVVKPARIAANQLEFEKDQRVIFTNYMDHPVGEMFAVYEAARFYEQKSPEVCGLRTHHLFESNAFSEQIHSASPTLEVAEGAGIGFDNLLGEQSWQPL